MRKECDFRWKARFWIAFVGARRILCIKLQENRAMPNCAVFAKSLTGVGENFLRALVTGNW
jgi:hypothetical protein